MLDEGLHAGLGFLGIRSRTILFAEREAYPVAVLEARMQEGSIPPAPIWFGDLCELDAKQFFGAVDCVVAGFPCQDLSIAGRRAGLDGKRSGLFFEVTRIARDCGARYLFLENVAGIASATATVVDEAEGTLEERAASRVLGELADRGWHAEWVTLRASDVGASHGRERWFCWAWRELADAECACDRAQEQTAYCGWDAQAKRPSDQYSRHSGAPLFAPGPADPAWAGIINSQPWLRPALSIEEQHDAQAAFQKAQSDVRRNPDGLAARLDFSARVQRLKCCGNGVVAAQAAFALVGLVRRMTEI